MPEVATTTTTPETTEQTYKIVNLKAENFLKLKAVDITPGENPVIEITGANGAGKSSVLKAIWATFANRETSKEITNPIRSGELIGSVSINLGELIVTRSWTPSGAYLTVENAQGMIYKSPQKMLDELKTALTFDPLAFTRMASKDQRATLIKLLGIDTDSLDTERGNLFATRTAVNRQLNEARAHMELYDGVPVGPEEKISPSTLITEIREAQDNNDKRRKTVNLIGEINRTIEQLEKDLSEARDSLKNAETELSTFTEIDTAPLEERLLNLEEENKLIEKRIQLKTVFAKVRELALKSESLTNQIEEIDNTKRELLKSAQFPIDGLSFDETGVLFNSIPISQVSSAEQIKISVAMGMSMKPGLRVMLIQDGSLLDNNSRQVIEDLAKEYNMQVWIETVDADD